MVDESGKQHAKRVPLVKPGELAVPATAWPTIVLFAVAFIVHMLPPLLTWSRPSWTTFPISALSVYILFTPMHDAAHRAVSRKRALNDGIGRLCGFVFHAPFPVFRWLHLQHHKYTNDPNLDPDHWSSAAAGGFAFKPLFWMTQSTSYYFYYVDFMMMRPPLEVTEAILSIAGILGLFVWLTIRGFGKQVLVFFLVPRLLAEAFLAFSFDYVPHHPHAVTRSENIYKTTSMVKGLLDPTQSTDLTIPLLAQNYHNIHHLYPTIPFYLYSSVWNKYSRQLLGLGTPVTSWFGAPWAREGGGGGTSSCAGEGAVGSTSQ